MLEDLFSVVRTRFNYGDDDEPPKKKKTDIPKGLLFKCPRCSNNTFMEDFAANGKVCPHCNYHSRLTARERLDITIDKDSLEEFDADMISGNPIDFPDYENKQQALREKTGLKDAVVTGRAKIRGEDIVIIVMDSNYMMASMGSVVGEKIARAFEYAAEHRLPVIAFTASGGARMQEGIVSLMQMAKTSGAVGRHSDAGLLYITVMTDPTTGGVTASFASLGDIIIAEPKCVKCYEMRLFETARQAAEGGFDSFTSSLFISPYQKHELMREVAERAAAEYGVQFLYRDFRPGFRAGQQEARERGFYMQKYCGCVFSEEDRYRKQLDRDLKNPEKIIG